MNNHLVVAVAVAVFAHEHVQVSTETNKRSIMTTSIVGAVNEQDVSSPHHSHVAVTVHVALVVFVGRSAIAACPFR